MKILIACEFSGIIREAFTKNGHNAWSCDLLPTEKPGKHYQGYLEDFIGSGKAWDMIVAHPPCTHLASSGARWFKYKQEEQKAAIAFVKMIWNLDCPKICIENPIGILSRPENLGKPTQYIHPWQYGHGEIKKTCLWLKGLPELQPTNIVDGREPKIHHMPPSKERSKLRSLTYQGWADAMANQWV